MSNVFDYESSLRRMGDDHELFQEMVGLLKADAPPLLAALQRALHAGDYSTAHRSAHTLKGLAANFGAHRAVACAAEVERLAKQRQTTGLQAAWEELTRAFDELIAALSAETPADHLPLRT